MIKENKLKYLISSIIIILPAIVSLFIKNSVVNMMKGAWYFGWIMPVVMLLLHTALLILTRYIDPVKQNKKIETLIFFIIPTITLYVGSVFIALMLGAKIGASAVSAALLGGMLIVSGNYMPKAKRNRTFGIKLKWTLMSDENWIATHRFAGKVFVITGLLVLLTGFLPLNVLFIVLMAILIAVVIIPTVYSYRFYRRQLAEGVEFDLIFNSSDNKKAIIATIVIIASLVIILVPMTFMGKITYELGDDALNVKPSFGGGIEIAYSELDEAEIEYRDGNMPGIRAMGYGSAKLLYGRFENDEFGIYTRYTYTNSNSAIVIRLGDDVLVIADKTPELTRALYDGLVAKVSAAK